ncbi:YsnF/AvaK domain-containing protein [Paracraurococcus ruber]|uniref:YsnF/AvaK domain-containing protein n=1 Tax=Paracraurococcus ruber TaxID=77675 RepID=UPI0019067214|nr:YsnF/AvaK domain-containing protein [Paracraurococcus ruber]
MADDPRADTGAAIPLVEERLAVARRAVETGRVRIHLSTATEDALVQETLRGERMEVERVTLGLEVATAPAVREEEDGAVLVVPVLEEILVVERRLVLKEELRIRRIATTETVEETVPLRRQVASVERLPGAAARSPEDQARPEDGTGDPA